MRVGLLASTGKHLDSFFPDIRDEMQREGMTVFAAAGTPTLRMPSDQLRGMTQSPSLANIRAVKGLRDWARQRALDIVITNTATASVLVRAARLPIPIIYFCHGLHWNTGKLPLERLWQLLELVCLHRTSGVVTINSNDRAWFAGKGRGVVQTYFPSGVGVPTKFLEGAHDAQPNEPFKILWVGDFSGRKRPELAVSVASRLLAGSVNFELKMLGDGPCMDSTQKLINRLDLGAYVKLCGRVDSTVEFIDASQALLHTAKWEGLPRVLLEGVARRRTVIAFDVKGVRDIPHAVLVPDGDVEFMAEIITNLAQLSQRNLPQVDAAAIESSAVVAGRLARMARAIASAQPPN